MIRTMLVLFGLLLSGITFAQNVSPVAGGTCGDPFTLTCPAGQILVGIVATRSDISTIEGSARRSTRSSCLLALGHCCAPVALADRLSPSAAQVGQVLRGLGNHSGRTSIDQDPLRRIATHREGRRQHQSFPIRAGGNGGTAATLDCPNALPGTGTRAVGFWGRSNSTRLRAAEYSGAPATTLPDLCVAIRWFAELVISFVVVSELHVELWNVGSVDMYSGKASRLHLLFGSMRLSRQVRRYMPDG